MAGHRGFDDIVHAHPSSTARIDIGEVVGREAREERENLLLRPGATRARGAGNRAVAEDPDPEAIEAARGADYITFTSSSTVRNFVDAVGAGIAANTRIVSIGPVTSATLVDAGLDVAVEAQQHDPEGLVEALLQDAASSDGSRR